MRVRFATLQKLGNKLFECVAGEGSSGTGRDFPRRGTTDNSTRHTQNAISGQSDKGNSKTHSSGAGYCKDSRSRLGNW